MPVFAFRAEEFAYGHIDEALSRIGVHESLQGLSVQFPLHPRKLLFIDSLERLLEAESFDAFLMFLQRVKDDPTWRVVMTCRSYALEQVRDIFFLSLAVPVVTFDTPALTDRAADGSTMYSWSRHITEQSTGQDTAAESLLSEASLSSGLVKRT